MRNWVVYQINLETWISNKYTDGKSNNNINEILKNSNNRFVLLSYW